ncbi:hypothetical protein BDN70DRAFT_838936 [Pholiota conissans]|uniref:Protein kinase domain-containing protein n=1 Tax=Pholiota conissans TaxID=109636 RepID=A0A9P6CXJ4_9AGAR|nr:hypothetical protein BDN70DRAFT_838936 [Pholiota conissans]
MGDSPIPIQYVIIDDIDFTPRHGNSYLVSVTPSSFVQDMVDNILARNPPLQVYGEQCFEVLKIKQPASPETIVASTNSSRLRSRVSLPSLQPILEQFRKRSKESGQTELTNDYVQRLPRYTQVKVDFKRENVELVSAILVRYTTADERAERERKKPLESGITFRCKNLHAIVNGSSPSDTSGRHGAFLRANALMDRPADRYTFPVALFDKNLAILQHRLEHLDVEYESDNSQHLFPDEQEFYKVADKFILAAIKEYQIETERMDASEHFLAAVFDKPPERQYKVARVGRSETLSVNEKASTTKFDGAYATQIKADDSLITTTAIEVKTTVMGDPIAQLTKGYAEEVYGFKDKNYFDSTPFPKIFIALNGHKLQIAIAVCLETVVVNEILSLDMRDNFFRAELKQKVARVAVALKDCFTQLTAYYSELTAGPPLPFFPLPTLVPSDFSQPLTRSAFEASPNFRGLRIVGRLDPDNNTEMERRDQPDPAHMRHNLLLAKWLDHADSEPDLIVKLVKRYGKAAHECLAAENLAPKVYLCQPVIGKFIVVAMERSKGRPLSKFSAAALDALDKPIVLEKLRRVVNVLKKHMLVHGDLRAPNIVVDSGNPQEIAVNVVDFDWAAKHNEGLYPSTINTEELHKEWHSAVGPMKKMKMEHDKFAVFDFVGPEYLGSTR